MPLTPVTKRSAADQIFEQLVAELLSGQLEPGTALPAERSLTTQLEVNRQAVREALQRLAQAGLVRIRHGEPTRALDYRQSASLDLLPRLLIEPSGAVNVAVARSILEMRLTVGADVARLAARRATGEHQLRLDSQTTSMEQTDDVVELAQLDLGFWDVLVDAADNVAYRLAFNSLRATYEPLTEVLGAVLADELNDSQSRRALIGSVRDGDEEAAHDAARRLLAKGAAAFNELFDAGEMS